MFTTYLVLGLFLFSHEAWGAPQTTSASTGTQLSEDFNKNMALMMNNLNSGASAVASKPLKFALNTIPSIFTLGRKTAAEKLEKIASANNEALSKVAVATGNAMGSGGILVSSGVGGGMKVAGSALGAVNDVVETGATSGINILGKVGDKTAAGIEIGGTIGSSALTAVSDGMKVAASGTDVLAEGIAQLIANLGERTAQNMQQAGAALETMMDKTSSNMGNGVQQMSGNMQVGYYKILQHLLELITNAHKIMSDMSSLIKVSASASASTAGVEAATGTTAAASGQQTAEAASTRSIKECNNKKIAAKVTSSKQIEKGNTPWGSSESD